MPDLDRYDQICKIADGLDSAQEELSGPEYIAAIRDDTTIPGRTIYFSDESANTGRLTTNSEHSQETTPDISNGQEGE